MAYDLASAAHSKSVHRLRLAVARAIAGASCKRCRWPLVGCQDHDGCPLLVCRCPGYDGDARRHHRHTPQIDQARRQFVRLWRALPHQMRRVLTARLAGEELPALAVELGVSVTTVWNIEQRALARLGAD